MVKSCVYKSGLSTQPCKNQNLAFTEVLHALRVTKNLPSVSRLTSDNNILIEFNSSGCYIKENDTRELLFEGQMKEGLY